MSFHMQKKRLGLQLNQIFNQGIFFSFFFLGGGGGGGGKGFWRILGSPGKIVATPMCLY